MPEPSASALPDAELLKLVRPQLHVLRDYALLADGHRGALVGPEGDCTWLCFPDWADDPVLGQLIGGEGSFAVRPEGRFVWGGSYRDGSLIWSTRWVTCDGVVSCREALAAPGDPDRAVLLRHLRMDEGRGAVHIGLAVAADAGCRKAAVWQRAGDAWECRVAGGHLRLAGLGDARPVHDGTNLALRLPMEAGDERHLVLELQRSAPSGPLPDPRMLWTATETWWAQALPDVSGVVAERDALHATAVLRGLTPPGGAPVAAATASLPEHLRRGRSYDYRYVWCRDACYVGHAAALAGWEDMVAGTTAWVSARLLTDGDRLAPAYTSDGGPIPAERDMDLLGYPGSAVAFGNKVGDQFQLDTLGSALVLLDDARRLGVLDADGQRAMEVAAAGVGRRWTEPDAGVWELEERQWTHGRLVAAAGLRAAAGRSRPEWTDLADTLVSWALEHTVHPTGRWQRAPDDERVDAALLLGQVRSALPLDHPTAAATRLSVARDLSSEHLIYRYRHDDGELSDTEGAFLLCNFWMALAEHQVGDHVAALRWFERARSSCGPPALFCEEFDVLQRQLRGNLPQAFVHALLLETAITLTDPADRPRDGLDPHRLVRL